MYGVRDCLLTYLVVGPAVVTEGSRVWGDALAGIVEWSFLQPRYSIHVFARPQDTELPRLPSNLFS